MNTDLRQAHNENQECAPHKITLRIPPGTTMDCNFTVQPSHIIDATLKFYWDGIQNGGLWKSCYCEATMITVCKHVPLFEERLTFGESGIKDGDTLHLLVHCIPTSMKIFIHNLMNKKTFPIYTSALVPVSHLKKLHFKSIVQPAGDIHEISPDEMVLKDGNTGLILEGMKTLADYDIQANAIIHSDMPSYNISYVVPTFTEMKQIFLEPSVTLIEFCNDLKEMHPDCKGPFRSVLYNAAGTLSYVYIDIERMRFYTIKPNHNVYYHCKLGDHYTLKQLYEIVNGNRNYRRHMTGCFRKEWIAGLSRVADFVFDGAWISAFAPQIKAESTSMNKKKALRLYYFPESYTVAHLGCVHSLKVVSTLKTEICEREGLDPTNRVVLHRTTGEESEKILLQNETLAQYHSLFGFNPLVILRKKNSRKMKHTTSVYIQWITRTCEPVRLTLDADVSISRLKDEIETIIQVPRFMQKLQFSGKPLEDYQTLEEVGITNDSMVDLILPRNVGAYKNSSSLHQPWM